MVGVSNPLLRADRRQAWRFLSGFAAGSAVAAVTLVVPLLLLTAAAAHADEVARGVVLAVLLLALGTADLLNRTPHVWRQVPQRFARELQPGRLGFVWAYDLGLLVTTQKTTSLLWIGFAGLVLAGAPGPVVLTVLLVTTVFALGIAVLTVAASGPTLTDPTLLLRIRSGWVRWLRRASGLAVLGLAAVEVVHLL